MSILAIIPARSGSKRLAGKNLRPFCGKPLLQWTVEQAQRIEEIDEIIVTTDYQPSDLNCIPVRVSPDIQTVMRPEHLCGDDVPMAHVIAHVLGWKRTWPSLVVLLQPTSPTRTDETVRECIRKATEHYSMYPEPSHRVPTTVVTLNNQDPNGACYVFGPHSLPHRMRQYYRDGIQTDDIDINEESEFRAAEEIMKKRLAG